MTQTEIERIISFTPKPCPKDFPECLKQYWYILQFVPCPIQQGWLIYYEERDKKNNKVIQ